MMHVESDRSVRSDIIIQPGDARLRSRFAELIAWWMQSRPLRLVRTGNRIAEETCLPQ